MTDFDLASVMPVANNWLQTKLKYSGRGEARFQDPKGVVYGQTEVSVSEGGDYLISMEVSKINYDNGPLPLGLQQLLSKDPPEEVDGQLKLSLPPTENNLCESLVVKTANGQISAKDFNQYSWTWSLDRENGLKHFIHFHPQTFEYKTTDDDDDDDDEPVYWAAPLNNFLSYFQETVPALAFHPLRIVPSTKLPNNIPADKRELAEHVAHQNNKLIVFNYLGDLGFIEALVDYKEREQKLKSKEALLLTTAVMVGSVGRNSSEYEELLNWFPFALVDLLSLATGIEVGVPWIEIRSGTGKLLKRFHVSLGSPLYVNGSRLIDEGHHRGTGQLLSVALDFPDVNASYLRTATRLLTKGGRYSQSVEDKMNYLCRAFEALSEHHGLQKQNLLSGLDANTVNSVRAIISEAAKKIRALTEVADKTGRSSEKPSLQTIEGRVANAANTDRHFGLSVVALLEKFGLPDAKIVDAFLQKNPREDGIRDFASLLSVYRGRTIHVGYFDFRGAAHDKNDVWNLVQHLHDLLARIVLTILGYKGNYQPTTPNVPLSYPLDWVKTDTDVAWLCYGEAKIKAKLITYSKVISPKEDRR